MTSKTSSIFSALDTEALLDKLDAERLITWKPGEPLRTRINDVLVDALIDELVHRGIYPKETVAGNPNDIYQMARCYGARWSQWKGILTCSHCKMDLRDRRTGPPYKRSIGVTRNDRLSYVECPRCHGILDEYNVFSKTK